MWFTVLLLIALLSWPVVVALNVTVLDCQMRSLALHYARHLQPWRDHNDPVFRQVYDALQLKELCNITYRERASKYRRSQQITVTGRQLKREPCRTKYCIFVDARATESGDGSVERPVTTAHEALSLSRALGPQSTTIIFRRGIHSLHSTIELGWKDSGLTLTGYPGEQAWLSGAIEIPDSIHWGWDCSLNLNVRVANLTDVLQGHDIPRIASLFSLDKRLIRARYPNSDPETAQWGYASPDESKYSISASEVLQWHRPPKGQVPMFEYVDLRYHHPPKNDSMQMGYNIYASGTGGVCADLWGPEADSYWCSNASSGGWAEVDRECAVTGQLQIPVGMAYNDSSTTGQRLDRWGERAIGGIVHAWHSQSWAMHMFEIESNSPGSFHFCRGGGRQGGRNWCRCDQCTYAGDWCGQHRDPPVDDKRLISGSWLVENILAELDQPGEFYFDRSSMLLYLYPNRTATDKMGLKHLRFALLEQLIQVRGARDITISNLGLRDSAATYLDEWSAPSGGDWALHRGGALFIENSSNVAINNCSFRRLDGNAIFLSRRTRGVSIKRNIFEWLGENAVAMWGDTDRFDATSRNQPIGTEIEENVMRELGIFQKQSSAVGQNKAAITTIRNNIMFNMPRAAINFNDMMGGGDVVERNLIFNTCRESGDHGPINSWDRQPFLADLRDGTKSFVPLNRTIAFNLIFANYGASQGVDNDDGSSWYQVKRNVFYISEGFKMDYGGHDSVFEENLVISYPNKASQMCVGFGSFFPGHGHIVRRNACVVPRIDEPIIGLVKCNGSNAILHDNRYYTPDGSATVQCGYEKPLISFERAQKQYGLEDGSTVSKTPRAAFNITTWALKTLFPGAVAS